MKSRTILTFGLSAVVLGGTLVGCAANHAMLATAGTVEQSADAKRAAREADEAASALAQHKADKAVTLAEAAVLHDPRNAAHRALLGQAYLHAGRFVSAGQALRDALTLNPDDGRATLNLALAQIGSGDWASARGTLENHADIIPASDRGLALALAGDPARAIEVLGPAVRAPDADAKTRQNFALALALAGHWREARVMAAIDVPADQVDARILEWAHFARPANAYDQVAALLGVTAVQDAGQPVQLALKDAPQQVAVAAADPVDAYMPGATQETHEAERTIADASDEAAPEAPAAEAPQASEAQVEFAARSEIVQPVAAPRAKPAPVAAAATPARALVSGSYFVQLGAYDNAGVARDAWKRATQRYAALAGHAPLGAQVTTRAGSFYRLSVGGFAQNDAIALCRTIKAKGGRCFVRAKAGDIAASWTRGTEFASR